MLAVKFSLPDVPYSIAGNLSTKSYPIHSSAAGFTVKRFHKRAVTLLFFSLFPFIYYFSAFSARYVYFRPANFYPLFFKYYQSVFYTAAFLKNRFQATAFKKPFPHVPQFSPHPTPPFSLLFFFFS